MIVWFLKPDLNNFNMEDLCLQQDNGTSHFGNETIKLLQEKCKGRGKVMLFDRQNHWIILLGVT